MLRKVLNPSLVSHSEYLWVDLQWLEGIRARNECEPSVKPPQADLQGHGELKAFLEPQGYGFDVTMSYAHDNVDDETYVSCE